MISVGKTSAAYDKFKKKLETVQHLQEDVTEYITRLFSSGNLTEQQSEQTAGLLYVTNNIQRIADRCQDIGKVHCYYMGFIKSSDGSSERRKRRAGGTGI